MIATLSCAQDHFDAEAQRAALGVGRGDSVFALAGAGDHVLALLGAEPKVVFAVDPRPAQTYLLELKLAGLRALAHPEYLELLGVKESRRRRGLYQRLRWLLSAEADAYWSSDASRIERGVLAQGDRERALARFRRFAELVQGKERVERFVGLADPEAQGEEVRARWNGFVWRKFAGRVLSMALDGGDPERRLRQLERAMSASPARENHLLAWLFTGRYGAARPFYLRDDAFDALKVLANRVVVVCERPERFMESLPPGSVQAFAFGEAVAALSGAVRRQIQRIGSPSARFAVRAEAGEEPLPDTAPAAHVLDRSYGPGRFVLGVASSAAAAA